MVLNKMSHSAVNKEKMGRAELAHFNIFERVTRKTKGVDSCSFSCRPLPRAFYERTKRGKIKIREQGSHNLEKVLNFSTRLEKSLNSFEVLEKYLISLFGLEKSLKFTTLFMNHHCLRNLIILLTKIWPVMTNYKP